jgi:hypothetical protein
MLHVEEPLNNDVYIRILENIMVPSVAIAYPNNDYIFQQDNCSVHTARRVIEGFENHNISVFGRVAVLISTLLKTCGVCCLQN